GQYLGKGEVRKLSTSSPSPHPHTARPESKTGQNQQKNNPGLDFRFEASNPTFQPKTPSGLESSPPGASNSYYVPFLPTTSASCAITSKGFLTTPTLPREEVVTVREPFNRLGTFETIHERLGSSLRSPRSPTLHCAVVVVIVPTPFSPRCSCRCSRVPVAHRVQPSHPTLSPLPRLFPSYIEARKRLGSRRERPPWPWLSHGNSRPSPKGGTGELPWLTRG
ncbi:hypothetical protein CRG98_036512, partial [Punica granatum]